LYSVVTIFFIISFVYVWFQNIKENKYLKELNEIKYLPNNNSEINTILNKNYYKTLLAIPTLGLLLFTILPIIFMILVAFTNWDVMHYPPEKLFTWVGWNNFIELFGGGVTADTKLFFNTFKQVLS
jgi:arabinogalactan oligomer/maltooligosaccharide transport system permease protein